MDELQDDLIPARGVNAHVFCPRLFWLEYVAGEWADNEHTVEGRSVHKRVDKPGGEMAGPDDEDSPSWQTRSLWLSDEELGVTARLDLVDVDEDAVFPVDTKKGRAPDQGLWPADRVQLTLQALLLRAHGYTVDKIAAWYHGSRKRVEVELSDALIEQAEAAVADAASLRLSDSPPAPLVDSPKCRGCSLNAICLPDEVNAVGRDHLVHPNNDEPGDDQAGDDEPIRRVFPARDDRLPLYVQTHGTRVGLSKEQLKIKPRRGSDEEPKKVGLGRISQLNLMGSVQVTTQAMQACLRNDIPVAYFSGGGWFYGRTVGMGNKQVQYRIGQYEAFDSEVALEVARVLIADKIANARTLIRRNAERDDVDQLDFELSEIKKLRERAEEADNTKQLLGMEGNAARRYWGVFSAVLARDEDAFAMGGRNRRPPEDPTNALLSYGYALLVKDCTLAVAGCGLDPQLGMYHTPHHGRPALALDLMEPFRPIIVDSVVLQMIRRGEAKPDDFTLTGQAVAMKNRVRKKLIRAYERRMDELVTHPVFGYRISYRRILSVQARLMARLFSGELDELPSFRTR
jgi:CRISPR-associated protein Cas4